MYSGGHQELPEGGEALPQPEQAAGLGNKAEFCAHKLAKLSIFTG